MADRRSLNVVLAGEAGQGLQAAESLFFELARHSGYHAFATKEYMSRVRGGANSTSIRISARPVRAYAESADLLVALDSGAVSRLEGRIRENTVVVGAAAELGARADIDLDFAALARAAGSELYANSAAVGALCGLLEFEAGTLADRLRARYAGKGGDTLEGNLAAARSGLEAGRAARSRLGSRAPALPEPSDSAAGRIHLDGGDAVLFGALAGGLDVVFAYPMTPGSSVLSKSAALASRLSIVVEQVEDEIAAINMALGAWFAGARALVTTSGGGFALMTEGLSLSGVAEMPVVVHLAQRPGPATGMPTRTEQGDLNLALYAGHGDFPRVILSPGDLEEAIALSRRAMELADELQLPALILTDQYLVDTVYDLPEPDLGPAPVSRVVPAEPGYRRYALTPDGISPRARPGWGPEPVVADSHEHDEDGYISEDFAMRETMVGKRSRKLEAARARAMPPVADRDSSGRLLVAGWGSTKAILAEAAEILRERGADFALAHFPQVFPLGSESSRLLSSASGLIMVENNSTGQFADLVLRETGVAVAHRVLKSDGQSFSVEALVEALSPFVGARAVVPHEEPSL